MSVERQPFAIWVRYAHNPQEEKTPQMLLLTKQTKGKGRCSPSRPFLPHFSPSTSPLAVSLNAYPQGRVLKDVVGIGRGQPADLGSCKASTSQIISHFRLHKTTTRRRAWRKRQRKCLSMRRGVPDVTAIDLIFLKLVYFCHAFLVCREFGWLLCLECVIIMFLRLVSASSYSSYFVSDCSKT